MEVLLVEPSILIDTMFPVIFFEAEVVIEYVLSCCHFALFPLCLVVAPLSCEQKYVRIYELSLTMEVSFDELSLVDDAVVHLEFPVAVIPSIFVLPFVLVFEPGGHLL